MKVGHEHPAVPGKLFVSQAQLPSHRARFASPISCHGDVRAHDRPARPWPSQGKPPLCLLKPPGKARFTRLWNAREKADVAYRALAHQRVQVALEAHHQVALPGLPGPAALARVAGVRIETASHVLAALRADGADAR